MSTLWRGRIVFGGLRDHRYALVFRRALGTCFSSSSARSFRASFLSELASNCIPWTSTPMTTIATMKAQNLERKNSIMLRPPQRSPRSRADIRNVPNHRPRSSENLRPR